MAQRCPVCGRQMKLLRKDYTDNYTVENANGTVETLQAQFNEYTCEKDQVGAHPRVEDDT